MTVQTAIAVATAAYVLAPVLSAVALVWWPLGGSRYQGTRRWTR